MKGTVMGPVVTPPESNATARNYCSIETDKQIIKRYFEHDAQHGNHKKYAHTHGYRDYNRHIWNVRNLLRQYLKVRLGNGYDYSNNKANEGNEPQLS